MTGKVERYGQIVRVHMKPTLGRAKLKSLNPAQVRALYRAGPNGVGPRGQRRRRSHH